jgi:hypothetical protein
MRNHAFRVMFAITSTLVLSAGLFAQASGGTATAGKDLQGVWLFGGGGDAFDLPGNPPFQDAARTKFDSERNGHGPHRVIDFADNTDPFIKACDPLGVPRILLANHPFKVVQTPSEVILLYERSHDFREIYMDGREHPKDLDPSWWGHSIGKWDGDALAIDSVGFNDQTWLDYQGLPHSDALHVIERYTRTDHNTLKLDLTIDDPKDYKMPWTATRNYKLKPWDIGEDVCIHANEQNFENGIVKPAAAPAK